MVTAVIRTPPNQPIRVKPHVQAWANAVMKATGANSFGTYMGHSPPQGPTQALDIFHPISDRKLSAAIAQHAIDNRHRFGVRYVISRQRIWHVNDPVWRPMANRGDATQNHEDHVHVTFEATAAGPLDPEPQPTPAIQEESDMFRYWSAEGGLRQSNGIHSSPHGLDPAVSQVLDQLEQVYPGKCPILNSLSAEKVAALDALPPFPGQ